jgi:hypothetical protein
MAGGYGTCSKRRAMSTGTKIDAHIHIVPAHPLGKTDRRFSVANEAHGTDKPVWGSDIPGALCYGTYSQLADAFEGCPRFTAEQQDRNFHQNAQKAYF